jgi:hypothetical protein
MTLRYVARRYGTMVAYCRNRVRRKASGATRERRIRSTLDISCNDSAWVGPMSQTLGRSFPPGGAQAGASVRQRVNIAGSSTISFQANRMPTEAWALFFAWERPSRGIFLDRRSAHLRHAASFVSTRLLRARRMPHRLGWILRLICPGRGVHVEDTGCRMRDSGEALGSYSQSFKMLARARCLVPAPGIPHPASSA